MIFQLVHFIKLAFRTPTVLALLLAFVATLFGAMVLYSWMTDFLVEKFEYKLSDAAFIATVYPQVASMVGAFVGGWLADWLRRYTLGGRIFVQALAVVAAAPFVYLCGQTYVEAWLIVALIAWGFFKGLYDANIFAALFDVIPVETRGTAAGYMNFFGWLFGGASAPLVIGILADSYGKSFAISSAAWVYVAAAVLLILAGTVFVKRDVARLHGAST